MNVPPCCLCGEPRAALNLVPYATIGEVPEGFTSPRGWFCAPCNDANKGRALLIDFLRGGEVIVIEGLPEVKLWTFCDKAAWLILLGVCGLGMVLLGWAVR